jgi:hypothetical protein
VSAKDAVKPCPKQPTRRRQKTDSDAVHETMQQSAAQSRLDTTDSDDADGNRPSGDNDDNGAVFIYFIMKFVHIVQKKKL